MHQEVQYITVNGKNTNNKKRKPDVSPPSTKTVTSNNGKTSPDFSRLDVAALKKYKREYKLKTRHNSTKAELVVAVAKHFTTFSIPSEVEIIEAFIETVNNQGYSSGINHAINELS